MPAVSPQTATAQSRLLVRVLPLGASVPSDALDALDANPAKLALPDSLVIAPWGTSYDLDGEPVLVNERTLAVLEDNQRQAGFEEVVLDFSHNSHNSGFDDQGQPIPPKEPLPVAAYGTLSVQTGVGIIFTPTRWTTEASYYAGGHYKDLSPTVLRDQATGEVLFVHSVALTRNGQISNLHAYAAPDALATASANQTTDQTTTKDMEYIPMLADLLGLDPEMATEEDVAAAYAAKKDAPKPMDGQMTAMSAPSIEDFQALTARVDQAEKAALINEATLAGKVVPLSAEAVGSMSTETLREMIGNLPADEVPLAAKTPRSVQEEASLKPLSAEEKLICKQLNITEEEYREQ